MTALNRPQRRPEPFRNQIAPALGSELKGLVRPMEKTMDMTPLQAIREGLQYAPGELRKRAVPALNSVQRMVEYILEHHPKLAHEEALRLNGQEAEEEV